MTATLTLTPDNGGSAVTFSIDTYANYLIQNTPGDANGNRYRVPQDMQHGGGSDQLQFDPSSGEAFNSYFAWRGPYINDRVYPDPWGNRYASIVFALHTPDQVGSDGWNTAVVCYSAGPDEQADTDFNQPLGWTTGDDDQTVILHGGHW